MSACSYARISPYQREQRQEEHAEDSQEKIETHSRDSLRLILQPPAHSALLCLSRTYQNDRLVQFDASKKMPILTIAPGEAWSADARDQAWRSRVLYAVGFLSIVACEKTRLFLITIIAILFLTFYSEEQVIT